MSRTSTLRHKILALVGTLVLLSLLGSSTSLYRITEVSRSLDAINRVAVPLGRLFVQIQSDADIYKRELDRRLGNAHWKDEHWKPRPIPKWIEDVIESEVDRASMLISKDLPWSNAETHAKWKAWVDALSANFKTLRDEDAKLYAALEQRDFTSASQIYPRWIAALDAWIQQVQWGAGEYERSLRSTFSGAESQVSQLRTGLEIILVVVVSLSLLLLWLGERALRPLTDLTCLARDITKRGLRKEDKAILPDISLARNDEVSQLAREFHRMATTLLEREKVVESHKDRLVDSNRLLREMGELNKNILHSIHSVLIVTDLTGKITQCNPVAARWLGESSEKKALGSFLFGWPKLQAFPAWQHWLPRLAQTGETQRIDACQLLDKRVFGGVIMPLRRDGENPHGAVVVLEDLTDELDLQERLRNAEKLAAVGRMSAQVAHEVRNPLHSIGLEAEMAAEMAAKLGDKHLKQSLVSILASVDRLEKITENYLKLSRLSAGEKTVFDLGDVLESVLATYSATCEAHGVRVDWRRESQSAPLHLQGDRDLLEHALSNLMKNALQALQEHAEACSVGEHAEACSSGAGANASFVPQITWSLGSREGGDSVWIRIEDNGPGISPAIREKLFTPFATTRAQGTGLGLSFVKKVVDDHLGSIECVERPLGAGACFEICLPSQLLQAGVSYASASAHAGFSSETLSSPSEIQVNPA